MVGEVGVAAFRYLRDANALRPDCSAEHLESLLGEPLSVHGRPVRYRYPRQKAAYVAEALRRLPHLEMPSGGPPLRDALTQLRGVGRKTASWIVRNWLDADDVAILDIHVHRAGVLARVFEADDFIQKDYLRMEAQYLALSEAIGIRAGVLDRHIWYHMRSAPITVRAMLLERGVLGTNRCGLPPARLPRPTSAP